MQKQQVIDAYIEHAAVEKALSALRADGNKFTTSWARETIRGYKADCVYTDGIDVDGDEYIDGVHVDDIPTGPIVAGHVHAPDAVRESTSAKTLVFTCAQSNTHLHEGFFDSLIGYCEHRGAELHISQFTYNKASYGRASKKRGTDKSSDYEDVWYDPRIAEYVSDVSMQVTPDLVWCGELNILPTRINPLSTFQTYTRQASAVIPHAKIAMQSLPTMKGEPAKMLYSTGCVTQRNYIQKAAGQVADFHHVFGALVVEVAEDGTWWARQLNATDDGSFYDLTTKYTPDGPVSWSTGESKWLPVHAITHGDIHWGKTDKGVLDAVFRKGGVLDALMPREQFFHDTIDFMPRNHHNRKDPHFLHEMHVNGTDSVEAEVVDSATWLATEAYRTWCSSFIVVSNHDQAIEGWLRDTSAAYDPPNMRYWHDLNLYCCLARESNEVPRPFGYALLRAMPYSVAQRVRVLQEDDSYKILGSIEAGLHGHLGPNGARGNPKNLRTVGKANTAHTHTCGIVDGVYTAGVYGNLDMGYNKGLSGWSHTLIVTYANGKRALLTIKDGRAWR